MHTKTTKLSTSANLSGETFGRVVLLLAIGLLIFIAACSDPETPTPSPTTETIETPGDAELAETPSPLAPIFSVTSVDGEEVRLEDLLGRVPVYLLFVPTTTEELDRNQLTNIQSNISSFNEVHAEVVVIVSDLPTRVIDMRDDLGLEFALIADPLHVVASDWQVFDLGNTGVSSPASFVFDAHGNLIARLIAGEPNDRPSINEVLHAIQESLNAATA